MGRVEEAWADALTPPPAGPAIVARKVRHADQILAQVVCAVEDLWDVL